MAEMSVPAWPIPTHQTKLTMAKPHPTGMLMPQMPTPLMNSQVTAVRKTISKPNETEMPRNQPVGVPRVRTIALILSVIVANVWPGAITGVAAGSADAGRAVVVVGDA